MSEAWIYERNPAGGDDMIFRRRPMESHRESLLIVDGSQYEIEFIKDLIRDYRSTESIASENSGFKDLLDQLRTMKKLLNDK